MNPSAASLRLQEGPLLKLVECLLELFLRVHDDRTVPGHGLLERLAGDEQESDALVPGLHRDLVAPVEEDQRAVVRLLGGRRVRPADRFGWHREGGGGVAEFPGPSEDVREGVAGRLDREGLPLARRDRDIDVDGVGRNPLHRAGLPPEGTADDSGRDAVILPDLRDLSRCHLLIPGGGHLEGRREVRPQLEPVHPARRVALGHLLVEDPAPRRHPLDVPGGDGPAIPHAVAVLHRSRENVGDRLDAPVGMPREAGQVIVRIVIAEIIEQEERVELGRVAEAERAPQVYARAFKRRLGAGELLDRSNGHVCLQ